MHIYIPWLMLMCASSSLACSCYQSRFYYQEVVLVIVRAFRTLYVTFQERLEGSLLIVSCSLCWLAILWPNQCNPLNGLLIYDPSSLAYSLLSLGNSDFVYCLLLEVIFCFTKLPVLTDSQITFHLFYPLSLHVAILCPCQKAEFSRLLVALFPCQNFESVGFDSLLAVYANGLLSLCFNGRHLALYFKALGQYLSNNMNCRHKAHLLCQMFSSHLVCVLVTRLLCDCRPYHLVTRYAFTSFHSRL